MGQPAGYLRINVMSQAQLVNVVAVLSARLHDLESEREQLASRLKAIESQTFELRMELTNLENHVTAQELGLLLDVAAAVEQGANDPRVAAGILQACGADNFGF